MDDSSAALESLNHSTSSQANPAPIRPRQNDDRNNDGGDDDDDNRGSDSDSVNGVRNPRPMLARGAACDICRARKVKCDASRPYCTPCLKSSRGDPGAAADRCKYEGVTVAAAREMVVAARGGTTTGHAKGRKRKSEMAAAAAAAAAAMNGQALPPGTPGSDGSATKVGAKGRKPTKKAARRGSSSHLGGEPDSKRSRGNATPASGSGRSTSLSSTSPPPSSSIHPQPTGYSHFGAAPPEFIAGRGVRVAPLNNGGGVFAAGPSSASSSSSGAAAAVPAGMTIPASSFPFPRYGSPFATQHTTGPVRSSDDPRLLPVPPPPGHSGVHSATSTGHSQWPLGVAAAHIESDPLGRNQQQPQYRPLSQHSYQQQQPQHHHHFRSASSNGGQGYVSAGDEGASAASASASGGGGAGPYHVTHLAGTAATGTRESPVTDRYAATGGTMAAAGTVGAAMAAVTGSSNGDGAVGREVVVGLEGRIADLERQLKQQESSSAPSVGIDAPSTAVRSGYPGTGTAPPSSSYTFPAPPSQSQAQSTQHGYQPSPYGNSYSTSFFASQSPSSNAFFGAASPGSSAAAAAGHYGSGALTPGSYPPMQLVPPYGASPRAGSSTGSVLPPHERRGLSALSAAAAANEYDQGGGAGSPAYPMFAGSGLSRSNSPGTWAAASPSQLSSLRQASTYPRRGSEPDAYALSSPRGGAAVSAIRGQPSQIGTGTGLSGLQPPSSTVASTPSHGEASASGTTQATTPPVAGSINSSPQLKPGAEGTGSSGPGVASSQGNASVIGTSKTLPEPSAADAAAESASYLLDEFSLTPELYQILHPQYPLSLPPLSTLHHLLTTFFLRATIPSTMLSRAKILQSLVYGPADLRWPEEALLHAMCAYSASFVSPDSLAGPSTHDDSIHLNSSYLGGFDSGIAAAAAASQQGARRLAYWELEGDKNPRDYHYRHAKRCILEATGGIGMPGFKSSKRTNLLQVLQATILTCYSAYQLAQFMDVWIFAGLCTRLSTPLGLNHLNAWDFSANRTGPLAEDWGSRIRRTQRRDMLGPANDLEEHWERGVTFWMAFGIDRFASAITDLSTSIDEKDITTHLPCLATSPMPELAIDSQTGLIPSISISSPQFLEDSAVPVGSLGVYIRSVVVFGRVINFLQRFPRNPCELQTLPCSIIKASVKVQPEFVELDIALSRFKQTHSANFFNEDGNGIDMFSVCAYILPHVATILLHESFTDRFDRTPTSSLNRCLVSAKCIVNAMTILYHSSYDLGGIDPFIPWCWSVTGRCLVRDYATRRYWGAHEEALASHVMAESVLGFHLLCAEKKIPIAQSLADTLKGYLDNPETLLPIDILDYRKPGTQ